MGVDAATFLLEPSLRGSTELRVINSRLLAGLVFRDNGLLRILRDNPHLFYAILSCGIVVVVMFLSASFFPRLSLYESFLLAINTAALLCMGLDKSLASSPAMRIPETTIFMLSLLGGVPGTLLGIHVFKHKTRKAAFQFVLLLIVAAQCGVVAMLNR
jgi:uncharacterized membrane protein YsdA (DUF1294 family)